MQAARARVLYDHEACGLAFQQGSTYLGCGTRTLCHLSKSCPPVKRHHTCCQGLTHNPATNQICRRAHVALEGPLALVLSTSTILLPQFAMFFHPPLNAPLLCRHLEFDACFTESRRPLFRSSLFVCYTMTSSLHKPHPRVQNN